MVLLQMNLIKVGVAPERNATNARCALHRGRLCERVTVRFTARSSEALVHGRKLGKVESSPGTIDFQILFPDRSAAGSRREVSLHLLASDGMRNGCRAGASCLSKSRRSLARHMCRESPPRGQRLGLHEGSLGQSRDGSVVVRRPLCADVRGR